MTSITKYKVIVLLCCGEPYVEAAHPCGSRDSDNHILPNEGTTTTTTHQFQRTQTLRAWTLNPTLKREGGRESRAPGRMSDPDSDTLGVLRGTLGLLMGQGILYKGIEKLYTGIMEGMFLKVRF